MKTKEQVTNELKELGLINISDIHLNYKVPGLYENAIRRGEACISADGPLVVETGQHTGRSPNDKFIVLDETTKDKVWWGEVNRPMSEEKFENLYSKVRGYLQGKEIFVQDVFAGTDKDYRLPVRIITKYAWQSLFAHNLFVVPTDEERDHHHPEFTVITVPSFHSDPEEDETNSPTVIVVNFKKKIVIIAGTSYAGEIKKSIFTVMNFFLPQKNVMPMHCSANIGEDDDVAVLFGLSGTGKTTLSADPKRRLIGDDEHGWSDKGVFNFEGGCYAKVIRLSPEAEPEIYATTKKFGTVLENVVIDNWTREANLHSAKLTENTRAAYPLEFIDNIEPSGQGGHAKNIVMLTADAFGVLPPISKLTPEQAMYHFISGYTAKVAGTEKGITEPVATFSACFGAPFMPMHPSVYANLLGDKIKNNDAKCWLINTGWSGGAYGTGERMKIKYTRAMLNEALAGNLDDVETITDPIFGLEIPVAIYGVPSEILIPKNTWEDKSAYDETAKKLAAMFVENFKKFEAETPRKIMDAAPKI
jgi:phosphoenolpyruvate carboxykinase (ATP)